jgi:outer membrane protein TolC
VATAGASAFARSWRAAIALAWVEAAASESAVRARSDHLARIEALEIPVRRRTEAGVEAAWELHLLEEALARAERLLAEAEEARASSRVELSGFVGACVRAPGEVPVARVPADHDPTTRAEVGGAERPGGSGPEDPDPEVRRLEALAQVREAQARAIAAGDRWQVALVGSAGPTRSRAFDPGPVEQEYVVGVSGRIGLDLAGVGRTAERAGIAEAEALRADAESLRAARERERSLLELEIDRAAVRGADLDHEVTRAEARLEAARLRWEAGVDGWNPLLQAADRALEARLLRTNWALALAGSRIRLAELRGTLDALATDFSLAPEAAR